MSSSQSPSDMPSGITATGHQSLADFFILNPEAEKVAREGLSGDIVTVNLSHPQAATPSPSPVTPAQKPAFKAR